MPSFTSVSFEFQVTPTAGWPQASMIFRMRTGRRVSSPWTSHQISTPFSRANFPHSASDFPICSRVFSSGTSFGRPFGRTLTAFAPRSFARRTHSRQSATFFCTTAGSGEWNSQTLPRLTCRRPASRHFAPTSFRAAGDSVRSTPWACVVRNSTPWRDASRTLRRIVPRSQSFATL